MALSTVLLANMFVFKIFIGTLERTEILVIKSDLVQYSLMIIFMMVQFTLDTFTVHTFVLLAILFVFEFYNFVIKYKVERDKRRRPKYVLLLVILATISCLMSYSLYKFFFRNLKESILDPESEELYPPDCFFLAVETSLVCLELACQACKIVVGAVARKENKVIPLAIDTGFLFVALCLRAFYVLFSAIIGYGTQIGILYPIGTTYTEFAKAYSATKRIVSTERALNKRLPVVDMRDFPNVDNTCLVCREQITKGRLMPCGHTFHEECIKPWLIEQGTCPACFKDVLKTNLTYEDTMKVLHHMNE